MRSGHNAARQSAPSTDALDLFVEQRVLLAERLARQALLVRHIACARLAMTDRSWRNAAAHTRTRSSSLAALGDSRGAQECKERHRNDCLVHLLLRLEVRHAASQDCGG